MIKINRFNSLIIYESVNVISIDVAPNYLIKRLTQYLNWTLLNRLKRLYLIIGRPENVKDYRKMSRTRVKRLVEGHTNFETVSKDGDIQRQKIDEALFSKVEEMCSIDNLT